MVNYNQLKSELIDCVTDISYPQSDDYYEKSSADGYAFLGAAKELLDLDSRQEEKEVWNGKPYGLRKPYTIKGTVFSADTQYLYTGWSCALFGVLLDRKDNQGRVNRIKDSLSSLPVFEDGYAKQAISYCSPKCQYIVPNVQAMAVQLGVNKENSLNWLFRRFRKGNWKYHLRGTNKYHPQEDGFHLAMMWFALRGLDLDKKYDVMREGLQSNLVSMIANNYPKHHINWQHGFLALSCEQVTPLRDKCIKLAFETVQDKNSNFRAKCLNAFALAVLFVDHEQKLFKEL